MTFKNRLRKCLLGLATTAAIGASAISSADTQITNVQIFNVGIYSGATGVQGAFVRFSPALPGIEGCTFPEGNQVWIDFTNAAEPDGRLLYETILKAYTAGKDIYSIGFGVRGCANGGTLPLVYRVDVALKR